MGFDRREFLKLTGAAALTAATTSAISQETDDAAPSAVPSKPKNLAAKPLKVLVLGGTGFVGPAVVESALERGHTLTLFNRGKTNPQLFPGVEKLQGDRDVDKAPGLTALKGRTWDAVVDTWTQNPKYVKSAAELLTGSVGQYLFVSTISVYSDFKAGIGEDGPLHQLKDPADTSNSPEGYGGRKVLCEQYAETALPKRVTVARPGLIVGHRDPTDRFPYWPARCRRGGEALAPGTGQDPVQWIDVKDLGDWIIRAVENKTMGIFNLVGPGHRVPIVEYIHACKAASSNPTDLVWVSEEFLTEQKVSPFGDMPMWLPASQSGMFQVSNRRALDTGLKFRPLADTIRDALAWFAQARSADYDFNRGFGLTREREKTLLASWKARVK
jgi:2'-hydroxyisoflavone reductase